MLFDASRALEHIRSISFPRLSSSPGERRAGDYIISELKSFGLEPKVQSFSYSLFPYAIVLKASLIFQVFLLLYSISICVEVPFLAGCLAVFLIAYTLKSTRWGSLFEVTYDIGPKRSSRNIYERISGEDPHTNIIFLAHYDSKSQTIPILFRVLFYSLFYLGMLCLSLLLLALMVTGLCDYFREGLMHAGVIVSLFTLPVVFNFTKNSSPGALDNASGVGIVLELARTFASRPPVGLDITFLFTGAEEVGLAGAIRYVQRMGFTYNGRRTFCVSYDGAGAKGKLRLTSRYGIPPVRTSRELVSLAKELCKARNIDCVETYLPVGAGLEQTPISYRGFEVITIHSGKLDRTVLSIHSKNDRPDGIDTRAVERCGHLGEVVAHTLAKRKK